jgi:hypothetical protein
MLLWCLLWWLLIALGTVHQLNVVRRRLLLCSTTLDINLVCAKLVTAEIVVHDHTLSHVRCLAHCGCVFSISQQKGHEICVVGMVCG